MNLLGESMAVPGDEFTFPRTGAILRNRAVLAAMTNKQSNPELVAIAAKLDQTNELLNELLRSQARLEGVLSK